MMYHCQWVVISDKDIITTTDYTRLLPMCTAQSSKRKQLSLFLFVMILIVVAAIYIRTKHYKTETQHNIHHSHLRSPLLFANGSVEATVGATLGAARESPPRESSPTCQELY